VTRTTTAEPIEPTTEAMEEPRRWQRGRGSIIEQLGLSGLEAVALLAIGLGMVAYFPFLQFGAWTARVALLWLLAPVGLLIVVALARRGDRAAIALSCFLVWTVICGAAASSRTAMLGTAGTDLSTFTVVGVLAMWGLGRALSGRAREMLIPLALGALATNGLVAILQVLVQVDSGPLALYYGRAGGLTTHPVYLGALCASGMVLMVATGGRLTSAMAGAHLLIGIACMLSGSRAAVVSAIAVTMVLLALRRDMATFAHASASWLALAVGQLLASLSGGEASAASRVATGESANRIDAWRYGLHALADRPIFGWGFGRFAPAVQRRFDVGFVRATGVDDSAQIWFDAHNVVVAVGVATGVVGLALVGAWLAIVLLRSGGAFLWALIPIAASWLLQPVALATAPVSLLMLGAAFEPRADVYRLARPHLRAAVLVGSAVFGYVLCADLAFKDAVRRFDVEAASRAAVLYAGDPVVADLVAQMHLLTGDTAGAVEWGRRVVDSQPDRPYWWTKLAGYQRADGDIAGAAASIDVSFRLRPVNFNAALADLPIAIEMRDRARLLRDLKVACALSECSDSAEALASKMLSDQAP
jgi:O-antigen ligase